MGLENPPIRGVGLRDGTVNDHPLPDLASVEHAGDQIQPYAVIHQLIQDVTEWQDTFKRKATRAGWPGAGRRSCRHSTVWLPLPGGARGCQLEA